MKQLRGYTMHLALIQTCIEDQHTYPKETSLRSEWTEQPLHVGDLVSMGLAEAGEKRWQVAQVDVYKPALLGRSVEAVSLVQVCRADLHQPAKSEWLSSADGNGTLYTAFEAVGGEERQIGECFGNCAEIWTGSDLDSLDLYLPAEGEHVSYPSICLLWCKPRVLQLA